MENEHLNKVDFVIKLTGSVLFDLHTRVTAQNLCNMFPLQFTHDDKEIHIFGEMNDFWYQKWCKTVLSLGEN